MIDFIDLCEKLCHETNEQKETINELQNDNDFLKTQNKTQKQMIINLQLENNALREEKTGKWISVEKGFVYECSECHKICYPKFPYYPICGSRMEEVKPIDY